MQLPATTPKSLDYLRKLDSDDALYEQLIANPPDLILFFETAVDDETWADNHSDFVKKTLDWLTVQVYQDRLLHEFVSRAARAIRRHYSVLNPHLERNITVKLKDGEFRENSLLLSADSHYFRQIMLQECRDKETTTLHLGNITREEYTPFHKYANTGDDSDILTMGKDEILTQIKRMTVWGIAPLSKLAQKCLAKYLTLENALPMVIKARHERWFDFAQHCADYIASRDWGYRLEVFSLERLGFEFLDFREDTLKAFATLRSLITDIICHGRLTEEVQFGLVLKQCPSLLGVDISKTPGFTQQFLEIPRNVQDLNLSECPWLSKDTLKQFSTHYPDIRKLEMASDVHLNYSFWGELGKFKHLKRLYLDQCHQIQDSDLSIIVKGCGQLTHLSLNHCIKITETGFLELAKKLPRLADLEVSRCAITDNALVEIGTRCRALTILDISNCRDLTEKGILAFVKNAPALKELDITRCRITDPVLQEIKRLAPLRLCV